MLFASHDPDAGTQAENADQQQYAGDEDCAPQMKSRTEHKPVALLRLYANALRAFAQPVEATGNDWRKYPAPALHPKVGRHSCIAKHDETRRLLALSTEHGVRVSRVPRWRVCDRGGYCDETRAVFGLQ